MFDRLAFCAALCVALAPQCALAAAAPEYPVKPVRLIIPYPPGGGTDVMGRAVAERLGPRLGQQVIVDNRAGAATAIGAELAARAPADGYTLLVGTVTTLAVNPGLRAKLPYDPVRDFDPISMLASQPQLLVAHPSLQVTSVKALIALAKAKPGALNFASPGVGSGGHLAGELFKAMAGIDLVHVAYKGAGPAVTDLLGGQVGLMFATMSTVQASVNSGKLVALAVSTPKRSPAMPQIPSVSEAGLPGYAMRSWNGLLAPRGVPKALLQRLNAEVVAILTDADFVRRLGSLGFEPDPSTPEEFAAFIRGELALHAKIIRTAGLRAE